MYHPTTRVLTVLELLQAHRQMSGPKLAERLEVDVRSVRRYIVMLQDLGIPIETERGRYGSYRLMRGFKMPPLMFTEEEALALTLGLLAARRLRLTMTAPAIEGALAKIDRVLPEKLRGQVQSVQETLDLAEVYPGLRDSAPESSIVLTLSSAVQQEQQIFMRYQSSQNAVTERVVDPYSLTFHAGRWYTQGYCHLRQDLRIFRLDRVLQADLLDAHFTRPASFNSLEEFRRAMSSAVGAWKFEVKVELPWGSAERRVPPNIAMLEQLPGGDVLMSGFTEDLPWLAHFLVGLNCGFIVREPDELRQAIRQVAYEVIQQAERDDEP